MNELPSDTRLTLRQNYYWSAFLVSFLLPFLIAPVSPLIFGSLIPAIALLSIFLYRPALGAWPNINLKSDGPLLAVLVAAIALFYSSASWSVDKEASYDLALKLSLFLISGYCLLVLARNCPEAAWRKYYLFFPFAVLITGATAASELFFGFPLYRMAHGLNSYEVSPDIMNRHIAVFVLSFPVSLYLSWKSRSILFSVALLSLGVFLFLLSPSQPLQFAIIVTILLAFGCLSFIEKITIAGFFLFAGFLFLMMPWIVPTAFDLLAEKLSASSGIFSKAFISRQLEDWDFISRRIMEKPWSGFGLDATRAMTYDSEKIYSEAEKLSHPHNAALHLWIEFGALGALAALGFFAALYRRLIAAPHGARRIGFLAFAASAFLLFSLWQIWSSWLLGFLFSLAALIILAAKSNTGQASS